MNNNICILEKVNYDCPICEKEHMVEKVQRDTQALVKGELVTYSEIFYRCPLSSEEENEFEAGKMTDLNLLNARNAYRKIHNLLTSYEIAEIRKKYCLTQVEFSKIFGWGDVTVTRYETKAIQDETYNTIMKLSNENPMFLLQNLEKNKDRFIESRYNEIKNTIIKRIEDSALYFVKQEIDSQYILYDKLSDFNGYKKLDINKIINIISYYAKYIKDLYKVKLMKLLWYTDVICYKKNGCSMTGLVYTHQTYGALPVAYDELLKLPSVKVEQGFYNDNITYCIVPSDSVTVDNLTFDEMSILQEVATKFRNYTSTQLVDYMHNEMAYIKTKQNQIISYDFAKELNEF